jgi:WD40 repeat protein
VVVFSVIRLGEIGPAGRWLLLGRDRRAGVFDRRLPVDAARFVDLGSHWDRAIGATFDAAGRRGIVYSSFGSVHVVDLQTGQILLRRPPKQKTLYPDVVWAGFGAGDDELLVALTDGTVERWRISTALPVTAFQVSVEPVQVDFTVAGDRLVVAGRDHTVRVWDAARGRPLAPPARHHGRILHLAFSPDGAAFVTASADGAARVWDTATGQPLPPFLRHAGAVHWAEFHPDDGLVVTAGSDRVARLWPLHAAEQRSAEQLVLRAQLYSARRLASAAGAVPLTGPQLQRLFQLSEAHRLRPE